jgi:CRISPR system Cascade subunit CasE
MYLSCLLINVGDNPDRPRPGRAWLRNLYHVHQRLCMAFPSASRKAADPDFLKPYNPSDFGTDQTKQVHVQRCAETGFLFRIDPQPGGGVVILVQSAVLPEWDYAFHNAPHLLAANPEVRTFDLRFAAEERLRFRLLANPTRKIDTKSAPDGPRRNGKRVPVPNDKLYDWLACRAAAAGFSIDPGSTSVQPGYVYVNKQPNAQGQRLRSARYDGLLTVTDASHLREALMQGLGPGKAFGFGLLSVARVTP